MSARDRKKHLKKANKKLDAVGAGTAHELVQGTVNKGWNNKLTAGCAVFGVLFLIGLALGYVFFPGAIWIYFGYRSMRPKRMLAFTSTETFVLESSLVHGGLAIVGRGPLGSAWPTGGGGGIVLIGEERIELNAGENFYLSNLGLPAPVQQELQTPLGHQPPMSQPQVRQPNPAQAQHPAGQFATAPPPIADPFAEPFAAPDTDQPQWGQRQFSPAETASAEWRPETSPLEDLEHTDFDTQDWNDTAIS